jgi:hypothetical protein
MAKTSCAPDHFLKTAGGSANWLLQQMCCEAACQFSAVDVNVRAAKATSSAAHFFALLAPPLAEKLCFRMISS